MPGYYCCRQSSGGSGLPNAWPLASKTGAIRSDVDASDLLKALSGICLVSDQPDWQDQARRLVSLLHDGLRYVGDETMHGAIRTGYCTGLPR